MEQTVIVILIVGCALGYLSYAIYRVLFVKSAKNSHCSGCTGCEIKKNMDCISKGKVEKKMK